MTVYISLLRGINVGGNKKIKMDALRALYQSLGLQSIQTLLQSGNVIFQSEYQDRLQLAGLLEAQIEQTFGFQSRILLRTLAELQQIIGNSPFTDQPARDPARLLVMFLSAQPDNQAILSLQKKYQGPEEFHIVGNEIFLYYNADMARSKLTNALIEKELKQYGTARNWNTVNKLIDAAKAVADI